MNTHMSMKSFHRMENMMLCRALVRMRVPRPRVKNPSRPSVAITALAASAVGRRKQESELRDKTREVER